MSYVNKICISPNPGNSMLDCKIVEVISGKGIMNDRYFDDTNEKDLQITLIESENIDYYNKISNTNIPYINFRRNIITSGVKLNDLVGTDFFVGSIKLRAHRLCDPCKYLQDMLKDEKLVKKLINRGGLRCEVLSSGKISINDQIKII